MHIIGKYIFDLKATTADGLSLQKELQQTIEQKLLPRMEHLFDGIAAEDVSIAIDQIDVEIDIAEGSDWLDKLLDEILEKMQANILTQINYVRNEVDEHKEGIERLPASSGLFKSKALMAIEKLAFFLKNGYLPWWCAAEEFNLKEESIIEALQSSETSTNDTEFLKQELRITLSNEKAIERLFQQFSVNLFHSLVKFLVPLESLSILETIEEYELFEQEKKLPELYGRKRMDEFKKDLLLTALKRHSDMNWKKFIEERALKEVNGKFTQTLSGDVDGIHGEPTIIKQKQSSAKQFPRELDEKDQDQLLQKDNDKDQARVQLFNQKGEKDQPQQQEPNRKNEKDQAQLIRKLFSVQDVRPDEEIFIANAGLVIVAPFLPRLFENLGWLRDIELLSPIRAIYLLHYLGSGNPVGMEYEFTLNKILCGVDVNEPLSHAEDLGSNELEEANKVLMAILEHWKVLKNTSIEGLRESFLLRNGKLSRTDDKWLLQVEQKSYDMLLQSLPWTINLIQLPFMKTSLNVEWT